MDDPSIPTFTWQTIKTGLDGPGPRSRHGLVYDRGAEATVLFGGLIWVGEGPVQSDTWELKDGHWSEVKLVNHPPGRHRGAMVFDAHRGVAVLFGGQADNGEMFGGTWIYARRRWRKRPTWWWRSPEPRCGHSMAFDEPTRRTVLFGGVGRGDRTLGDTWLFDGGSWREVDGPHPQSRRYAAFAYDPGLQGCVLHGGSVDDAGRQQFGDAWLFRDRTWTRLPAGFKTDVRDDHGLAYHRSAGRLVLLDGIRMPEVSWSPRPAAGSRLRATRSTRGTSARRWPGMMDSTASSSTAARYATGVLSLTRPWSFDSRRPPESRG